MNYETAKVLGTRRGHRERHRIRPARVELDVTGVEVPGIELRGVGIHATARLAEQPVDRQSFANLPAPGGADVALQVGGNGLLGFKGSFRRGGFGRAFCCHGLLPFAPDDFAPDTTAPRRRKYSPNDGSATGTTGLGTHAPSCPETRAVLSADCVSGRLADVSVPLANAATCDCVRPWVGRPSHGESVPRAAPTPHARACSGPAG